MHEYADFLLINYLRKVTRLRCSADFPDPEPSGAAKFTQ